MVFKMQGAKLKNPPFPFLRGGEMSRKFDVFKRDLTGHPIWMVAVEGLEEAKERMNRFAEDSPGQYFIYSEERGIVLNATDAEN
jgi:hypothetical protein